MSERVRLVNNKSKNGLKAVSIQYHMKKQVLSKFLDLSVSGATTNLCYEIKLQRKQQINILSTIHLTVLSTMHFNQVNFNVLVKSIIRKIIECVTT